MAGRLLEYERLLRQLSLRAEVADHMLIEKTLDKVGNERSSWNRQGLVY